jgi:hypothetical protein
MATSGTPITTINAKFMILQTLTTVGRQNQLGHTMSTAIVKPNTHKSRSYIVAHMYATVCGAIPNLPFLRLAAGQVLACTETASVMQIIFKTAERLAERKAMFTNTDIILTPTTNHKRCLNAAEEAMIARQVGGRAHDEAEERERHQNEERKLASYVAG